MFKNEYVLSVDLKKKTSTVVPTFVQYDSASLIFRIFDNGKPYDLTDFTRSEVSHRRPDDVTVIGTGLLEQHPTLGTVIRYTYLGNEMNKTGFVETSLSLFSVDKKVSIQPFGVSIVTDLRDGLVDSSEEEVGLLQDLIAEVESAVEIANQSVVDVNGAILAASNATDDAIEATTNANTATTNANTATGLANTATANANAARDSANTATSQANNARDSANTAATNANNATALTNTATSNANTATTNANNATTSANTAKDNAITATTNANNATTGANTAKTNAETATSNANTATTNANTATANAITAKNDAVTATGLANTATGNANTATTNAVNATNAINTVLPNVQGLVNKGAYNVATAYVKNNLVENNGSSFQALQNSTGQALPVLPTKSNAYWQLMAQRGIDGEGSVGSVNSVNPDVNGNVALVASDIGASAVGHGHAVSEVTGLQGELDAKIDDSEKGVNNGIATLGADGILIPSQRPSIPVVNDASTTVKGIVMLEDSVTSASITKAATPKNVKAAYDLANSKSSFSGSYVDLTNKPTIPTQTSQLTNDSNFESTTGAQAKANTAESNAKSYSDNKLTTHEADYLKHTGYAVATGSANTYIATLNPALSAYAEGISLRLKINVANTGASTVNVNGLGAKAIKKSNGNDVASGNLKLGSVYTLAYDGTSFILQGEGGEYGTAVAGDVLSGKSIGTDAGIINGNLSLTGTAVDADVLTGKTYYNTDAKTKRTGTLTPGKKWASGTSTIAGGAITITGLTFTASLIVFEWTQGAVKIRLTYNTSAIDTKLNTGGGHYWNGTSFGGWATPNLAWTITSTGFSAINFEATNGLSVNWRAYE